MAPWRLASQSEADPDESLESELVSSLESLLESPVISFFFSLVSHGCPYRRFIHLEMSGMSRLPVPGLSQKKAYYPLNHRRGYHASPRHSLLPAKFAPKLPKPHNKASRHGSPFCQPPPHLLSAPVPPPPQSNGAVTRVVCPRGPPVYAGSSTTTQAPSPGRLQGRAALSAPWSPSSCRPSEPWADGPVHDNTSCA